MSTQPASLDGVSAFASILGGSIYAYTEQAGWVCLPVDLETFESHALMFHNGQVNDLGHHHQHHAAGVDPAFYVAHRHKEPSHA